MINFEFSDISSNFESVSTDSVGLVISYPSEPTKLLSLTEQEFLHLFPLVSLTEYPEYLFALACYKAGLSTIKVISIGDTSFQSSSTKVIEAYTELVNSNVSVLLVPSTDQSIVKAVSNIVSTNFRSIVVSAPDIDMPLTKQSLINYSNKFSDTKGLVIVAGTTNYYIDNTLYELSVTPYWVKSLITVNSYRNLVQVPSNTYGYLSISPLKTVDFSIAREVSYVGVVSLTESYRGVLFYGIYTPCQSEPFNRISACRVISVLVSELVSIISNVKDTTYNLADYNQLEASLQSVLQSHIARSEFASYSSLKLTPSESKTIVSLHLGIVNLVEDININFSVSNGLPA